MPVTARLRSLTKKKAYVNDLILRKKVVDAAEETRHELLKSSSLYPPPKLNSHYIRTMRLLGGWKSSVADNPSGIIIRISNTVYYADRVVGASQMAMHEATGWPKFSEQLDKSRKEWQNKLQDIYDSHPILDWR